MKKRFKVEQLYNEAKLESSSLLPVNTNFSWWEEYENNSSIFDRYILDTFRDFYYWPVFSDSTQADALADFKEAVNSFLFINQKRYAELYRLHVLPEGAYDMVNNYSLVETHESTFNEGARTDSSSNTLGARTDSASNQIGARADTIENDVSAFNSTDYQDSTKTYDNTGAQTNSSSATVGAQSNSASNVKGAQENAESVEIHRDGNIGVQTPADVIGGHLDLWDRFNFYKQIFDEIAQSYFVCQDRHR